MTKLLAVAGALLVLLGPTLSPAQQRVLRGHVLLVGKDDGTRPAKGARVELYGHGNPARTAGNGLFELFLPHGFEPGAHITLTVEVKPVGAKEYQILDPWDGNTRVPQNLMTEILTIRMLPLGSKRWLSDEGIERLISQAAASAKNQAQPEEDFAPRAALSRYIADWAHQYGFSASQVKEEVDRWVAQVEKERNDERRLALAAFAKGQFDVAAGHARSAAVLMLQRRAPLEQESRRLAEEAVHDFELEGNAYFNIAEFAKALEAYGEGLKYVSRQDGRQRWNSLLHGTALAHCELGVRVEGRAAREHLAAAIAAMHQLLEVGSQKAESRDWARSQRILGYALRTLADRTEGESGTQMLAQAVEAYRLALKVQTREAFPQEWARLQLNLGDALRVQAARTEGEASTGLLVQSVEAHHLALSILRHPLI